MILKKAVIKANTDWGRVPSNIRAGPLAKTKGNRWRPMPVPDKKSLFVTKSIGSFPLPVNGKNNY